MFDIKYTQNKYRNTDELKKIIKGLEISGKDIVLDIGAGSGAITKELSKYAGRVLAYEIDEKYFDNLQRDLSGYSNVSLLNKDFLKEPLPKEKFKVFSNIPFAFTSDIIRKITSEKSQMEEAYLFIQKESAERFIGEPKNTQISAILSYIYEMRIIKSFKRTEFKPIPNVDTVLLKIKRKNYIGKDFYLYRDFITYIFNQRNSNVLSTFKRLFTYDQLKYIRRYLNENALIKPGEIPNKYYFEIFNIFIKNGVKYRNVVNGYYNKYLSMHSHIEKRHRTTSSSME